MVQPRGAREQHSATELPVIMLAASSELSDINQALELGADALGQLAAVEVVQPGVGQLRHCTP